MKQAKEEIAIEDRANGHDQEEDSRLKKVLEGIGDSIDELQGVTLEDHVDVEQKLGVLQRLVTAVLDDKAYRQVLLTGAFDHKHEAMLAADAITERKRYGVPITAIVDRVITQCAINGRRTSLLTETINSYTLKTNQYQPKWKKNDDSKSIH